MITKTSSFQTDDGAIHATLELAQKHELVRFLTDKIEEANLDGVADMILLAKSEIVDILTMKATSRPRARRVPTPDKKQESLIP